MIRMGEITSYLIGVHFDLMGKSGDSNTELPLCPLHGPAVYLGHENLPCCRIDGLNAGLPPIVNRDSRSCAFLMLDRTALFEFDLMPYESLGHRTQSRM